MREQQTILSQPTTMNTTTTTNKKNSYWVIFEGKRMSRRTKKLIEYQRARKQRGLPTVEMRSSMGVEYDIYRKLANEMR